MAGFGGAIKNISLRSPLLKGKHISTAAVQAAVCGAAIRTLLSVDCYCDGNPSEPASFDPIALNQTALVVRIFSCFLCGITAGLLIRIFYRKKAFFNFNGFEEPKNRDRYGHFNPYLSLFWDIRLIL